MKAVVFLTLIFSYSIFAQEIDFKLDKKYENLVHPTQDTLKSLPESSNIKKMISFQTPIKAQGNRGTCTIFSTNAHLEALYMMLFKPDTYPDFSEQWLQYLNMANKKDAVEGSSNPRNLNLYVKYGIVNENDWQYNPTDWADLPNTSNEYLYCKKVSRDEILLKKCLMAHGDPDLIFADSNLLRRDFPKFSLLADKAKDLKEDFLLKHFAKNLKSLNSVGEIKYALARGIPLTMGIDFYYGAWNHKKSIEFGIGRDVTNFDAGLVGYPEVGSVDREVSKKKDSGHAVVVVGYDDNIVTITNVKMTDGTYKQFRYRGAYIIKNSWGVESLGKHFIYNDLKYPGYAYVTYKYAHEFGGFFELPYLR